jgi:hypothetical protein
VSSTRHSLLCFVSPLSISKLFDDSFIHFLCCCFIKKSLQDQLEVGAEYAHTLAAWALQAAHGDFIE